MTAGDQGPFVLYYRIREAFKRIEAVVGLLDAQIFAEQEEHQRPRSNGYSTHDNVPFDVCDLFQLLSKGRDAVENTLMDLGQEWGPAVSCWDRLPLPVSSLQL